MRSAPLCCLLAMGFMLPATLPAQSSHRRAPGGIWFTVSATVDILHDRRLPSPDNTGRGGGLRVRLVYFVQPQFAVGGDVNAAIVAGGVGDFVGAFSMVGQYHPRSGGSAPSLYGQVAVGTGMSWCDCVDVGVGLPTVGLGVGGVQFNGRSSLTTQLEAEWRWYIVHDDRSRERRAQYASLDPGLWREQLSLGAGVGLAGERGP